MQIYLYDLKMKKSLHGMVSQLSSKAKFQDQRLAQKFVVLVLWDDLNFWNVVVG